MPEALTLVAYAEEIGERTIFTIGGDGSHLFKERAALDREQVHII